MAASSRKKVKTLQKLINKDGILIEDQLGKCNVVHDYFEELFKKNQGSYNVVVSAVHERISVDDNIKLTAPFCIEEFRSALYQMDPDKAPGPEGLNPVFYRRFWDFCGEETFNACCHWLEVGNFPYSVHDTSIVLIPKCDNPSSMNDWRPISLCNVVYKLLSKVLANRLKSVLSKCISIEQFAFISGRSILDNVIVASEIIHHMKCKTRGKQGEVALKIDISNAYDRVNWGYLRAMMEKMGFSTRWVNWIMLCVSSVSYSVLVNSYAVSPIIPNRDLRQDDPLSPYLFIICAEGL